MDSLSDILRMRDDMLKNISAIQSVLDNVGCNIDLSAVSKAVDGISIAKSAAPSFVMSFSDILQSLPISNITANDETTEYFQGKFSNLLNETIDTVPLEEDSRSELQSVSEKVKNMSVSQIIACIASFITILQFVISFVPDEQAVRHNQLLQQEISESQRTNQLLQEQNAFLKDIVDTNRESVELLKSVDNNDRESVELLHSINDTTRKCVELLQEIVENTD